MRTSSLTLSGRADRIASPPSGPNGSASGLNGVTKSVVQVAARMHARHVMIVAPGPGDSEFHGCPVVRTAVAIDPIRELVARGRNIT